MKKLIPKFLKYPLVALYICWRCFNRGRKASTIVLNLAGVLPPLGSREVVHGGKVKLLHLREHFGDSWKKFNIGYFVSSGLPFAPALWLRIYRIFGIKIVWNQNGVAYPAWAREKTKSINKLMSPIHLSEHVVYQTEFCKKCSDKYLGKFNGSSSILINPVDTNHFKPLETPLPLAPLVIIMSGHHFESRERLNISLETVRKLKHEGLDIKLIIIGNTQKVPSENWIEVVGKFTQEEAPHLYQKAHILLHLKNLDPCPTIVLEALSCGLPVIGLKNGGMPELVDDKSGILIRTVEDFDKFYYPEVLEIVHAIKNVKTNLKEFSQGARMQSLKFDKEIWLKEHAQIFKKLCR